MHVNVAETREYYRSVTDSMLCDCSYCQSYRRQIKATFPKAAEYLDSLGVDMEKPFETSPLEVDEKGMLEYCGCQYVVFGHCRGEYHHRIDNVEFRLAVSYPSTGIEREHFVLELFPIRLKYLG